MKTSFLIALCVGLAVARSNDYTPFRPDHEYSFSLSSQTLTGNPHLTAQFSGLRINTDVTLQITTDYNCLLQCHGSEFFTYNGLLESLPTYDIVESQQWKRVDQKLQDMYSKCLSKPIMFRYEQGVVRELQVDSYEQEWCVNLQRGVLSLLQMDLTQQNHISDVDSPALSDILQQNKLNWDNTFDNAYRVMEESVDGECESLYTVSEQQEQGGSMMKVNRVRNYQNCQRRPSYDEGFFSSLVIDTLNKHNQTGLRSYCLTNATLSGERSDFVIVHSKQVSRQFYTPLAEETGEIASFSVQELRLKDSQRISEKIEPPRDIKPQSLCFSFSQTEKESQYHTTSTSYGQYDSQRVRVIEELLTDYISKCLPDVTPEAMEVLHKLMFFLRDCSAQDIIQVFRNIQTNIQRSQAIEQTIDQQKMKVMLDVIPTLGRPQLLPVMTFLIRENYLQPSQAANYFNLISLTIKPTVEVVKYLLPSSELMRCDVVQKNEQLRQSIVFCLATVHHGLTKAQQTDPIPQEDYEQITEQYKEELLQLYKHSADETDKLTVIKAIGNCGLPDFISFIEEVLLDQNTPIRVRNNAVYAMRRMPEEYQRKVHSVLLPIYRNRQNEPGFRCMALLAIMECEPDYAIIQNIIYSLYAEQSQEVGAFVYTYLKNVAESSRLSLRNVREHVRLLMKQARPFFPNNFSRNTFSIELLAQKMRIGEFLTFYMFDCPQTVYPNGVAASLVQVLYRKEFQLLTTGIRFTGMEEVLNRLIGPKSLLHDLLSGTEDLSQEFLDIIQELIKPQDTDFHRINTIFQNIMQKLGLVNREDEKFSYDAYVQVLGNELRYFLGDAQDITTWIKENKQRVYAEILDFLKQLQQGYKLKMMQTLATETVKVIPTPMGVPLFINQSYCHFAQISGSTKLSGNPFSLRPQNKVQFTFDGTPSYAVLMEGNMGVQLPLLRSGVSVKMSAIVQDDTTLYVDAEPQNWRYNIKYQIPQKPRKVIQVQAMPTSYIHNIYSEPSAQVYSVQAVEMKNEKLTKPVTMTIPYKSERFGMTVEHTIEMPNPKVSYTPICPLDGKHYYCFNRQETAASEQYVQIELYPGQKNEVEDIQKQQHYRSSSSRSEEEQIDDEILSDPSTTVYHCNVRTINTPKQINLRNYVAFLNNRDERRVYCTLYTSEASCNFEVKMSGFVNYHDLFYPKKSYESPVSICDVTTTYRVYDEERQTFRLTMTTGDDQSEIKVPVEPYYLYKLRQMFGARDITVTEGEQPQTSSRYWFSRQESSDCEDSFCRGSIAMPEVRDYAYKYQIHFDYEQSTERSKQYVRDFFDYLRYYQQEEMLITPKECRTDEGRVNVVARFASSFEKMHLNIDCCQYEAGYYYTARVPMYLRRALTLDSDLIFLRTGEQQENQHPKYSVNKVCSIDETQVRTFDLLEYSLSSELSSKQCEMLLANDCSNSGLFAVLYGRDSSNKPRVNVIFQNNVVQMRVMSGAGQFQVTVDNQKEYVLREGDRRSISIVINDKQIDTEMRVQDKTLIYNTQKLGLTVSLGQQTAKIKSNSLYSGKVCGLCGDYNGDLVDELRGPQQRVLSSSEEFVLSYVLESNTCNVQQLRHHHQQQQNDDERCEMVEQNLVLNNMQTEGEVATTCISAVPLDRCSRQCRAEERRDITKHFYCMPTADPTTQKLVNESKNKPLDLDQRSDVDKRDQRYLRVSLPTQCTPIYYQY